MNLVPNTVEYYQDKYKNRALHSGNPENRKRFAKVLDFCKGKEILDVACGEGYLTNLLATAGYNAVGFDFSTIAIARAKKGEFSPSGKFNTVAKFLVADLKSLWPFEYNSFDSIILAEIVEHFLDPNFLFREAKKFLKPGGRIIVTVPSYPIAGFPEHKISFSKETLLLLLSKSGQAHVEQITPKHFVGYVDTPKEAV